MLYYETDNNRNGKVIGAVAAACYLGLWVLLMLLLTFRFDVPDYGEGLLVDFGDVESATGLTDPADNIELSQNSAPILPSPDELMTQDFEEAPEVVAQPEPAPQTPIPVQQPQNTVPDRSAQNPNPVEEPVRQADPRLSFPGRTQGSTSASEGTAAEGEGNQGQQHGVPQGNHDGSGAGGVGTGFDLAGRTIVALPKPEQAINEKGKVVIAIVVTPDGAVRSALPIGKGTTAGPKLISAAIQAARKSRFNKVDSDLPQEGTITYNFELIYK